MVLTDVLPLRRREIMAYGCRDRQLVDSIARNWGDPHFSTSFRRI